LLCYVSWKRLEEYRVVTNMKNKHLSHLFQVILMFIPTSVRPEITFGDVACVAVPAAIGAWMGHDHVKRSIEAERDEKEQARENYQKSFLHLTSLKQDCARSKASFESIKNKEDSSPYKMLFLDQSYADNMQAIADIEFAAKQLRSHKKACELAKKQNNVRRGQIGLLNHDIKTYDQAIKDNEELVENLNRLNRIFALAKTGQDLDPADREFLDQTIKDHDELLIETDNKIAKTRHKFDNAKADLKAFNATLASDEKTRLLKGALVGGAIGVGIGGLTLGVIKWEAIRTNWEKKEIRKKHSEFFEHLYHLRRSGPLKILGLGKMANNTEIRQQFKKLSLQLHPDHNNDDHIATEKMQELEAAYAFLMKDGDDSPKETLRLTYKPESSH